MYVAVLFFGFPCLHFPSRKTTCQGFIPETLIRIRSYFPVGAMPGQCNLITSAAGCGRRVWVEGERKKKHRTFTPRLFECKFVLFIFIAPGGGGGAHPCRDSGINFPPITRTFPGRNWKSPPSEWGPSTGNRNKNSPLTPSSSSASSVIGDYIERVVPTHNVLHDLTSSSKCICVYVWWWVVVRRVFFFCHYKQMKHL